MKDKLEKNMYVRTKWGIAKIIEISEEIIYVDTCFQPIDETRCYKEDIIGEPSFNPIDLIEEGDFVKVRIDNIFINCFMVDKFEDENENIELGIGCYEDGLLNTISEYRPLNTLEILEVLTKEQFESMAYRLGDE